MIKIINIKFLILLILLVMSGLTSKAQVDPAFSQSYANPLYLSPSFTGLTNGSRVALTYRDQWPGIPDAYRTYSFSFDHFLENYSSGIGILIASDNEGGGTLIKQSAGLLYSYEVEVAKSIFVRPGIQFKYYEQKIDPTKLSYAPTGGTITTGGDSPGESYKKFDASVSGMIYSDFFWFGFSLDHLIKSNVGYTDIETRVPLKTIVYGGYKFKYREGYKKRDEQSVTLALNYFRQQDFNQMDFGVYWYINPMELGLLYRGLPIDDGRKNVDAAVMILGLNFGPMRVAYSYDFTMSDLSGYSNGANEVSFIYRFNQVYRKKGKRGAIPCSEPGVMGSYGRKYRTSPRKIF